MYPDDPGATWREARDADASDDRRDALIAARAVELAGRARSDEQYSIRPVSSVEEICGEGEHQHNCVGEYVDAVARGETDIWLMRYAPKPDHAFITVEVRDGCVRQAFGACNRELDTDELEWLTVWAEECGYVMPPNGVFFPPHL